MTLTYDQFHIFFKDRKRRCHTSSLARAAVTAAFSALALQTPAGAAQVGVAAKSATIGQSISLSGPLGAIGTDYGEGFELAIDDANRRGGVHGRRINLIQLDDAHLPDRALVNTRKLLVREPGKDAAGVVVSRTMPAPLGTKMAVSIEHRKLMKAAGKDAPVGDASMTGFVAARAFVQALKLAGTEPTHDKFISGLESGARFDVGGCELRFSTERHHDSNYVELTMIRSGGSSFAY